MDTMKIYNKMPISLQNAACFVEGQKIAKTRYGKQFWKYLSEYEERRMWTYEQLCEFRDKRLRRMIKHCYDTVPYYTKCFDEGGINPESIKHLDDLKVIPILNKEIVNRKPQVFLSSAIPEKMLVTAHTSGTTGAGFIFKTTQQALCEQWAVWWRYRRKLEIKFGTWCGLFGGKSIVPIAQIKPPFYRKNKPGRQIYFSAYHMMDANIIYYLKALEKYKPIWLHGYPSSISLLAQYMLEHNIFLSYNVKWITTGAENLLQQQKELIRRAFRVEPYQHYGMGEGIANISEDIYHKFHVDEDYSGVEFIYDKSIDAYRIIGTSFTNFAMPLLRYEVGDNAQLKDGDRHSILSIDGRKEDYLILSNGIKIGRLDHIFKDMINIKEAQIYQDKRGKITFRIVKNNCYTVDDEKKLKKEIKERLGKETYDIEYLESITRTRSGKLRFVVSEINKNTCVSRENESY